MKSTYHVTEQDISVLEDFIQEICSRLTSCRNTLGEQASCPRHWTKECTKETLPQCEKRVALLALAVDTFIQLGPRTVGHPLSCDSVGQHDN